MQWRADRGLTLGVLCLALASCTMPDRPRTGAGRAGKNPVARQVADEPVKIGQPYTIEGITYTPRDEPGYDEVGLASWYGDESGSHTANGERFRPRWISAAHKTLPLPSYVEVTALASGRTILLRINDRGPFVAGRIIDLSHAAAEALGMRPTGTAAVRVRRVDPPERDRIALRSGRSAAPRPGILPQLTTAPPPFPAAPTARPPLKLDLPPPEPLTVAAAPPVVSATPPPAAVMSGWYVQVGAFANRSYADSFLVELKPIGRASVASAGAVWRARIGPYDESGARAALAQAKARGYQGAMLVRPEMNP